MNPKFIKYFMEVATLTGKLSYAKRLQVGAVIVKGNQIIGTGYNGMPAGWDNNCEEVEFVPIDSATDYESMVDKGYEFGADKDTAGFVKLITKPEVLHAESNALAKVARSTENSDGATLFCTHAPCLECAKLIYQSGIKKVYYRNTYRSDAGLKFLKTGDIDVHQYDPET